jgi:hypothetical protein
MRLESFQSPTYTLRTSSLWDDGWTAMTITSALTACHHKSDKQPSDQCLVNLNWRTRVLRIRLGIRSNGVLTFMR